MCTLHFILADCIVSFQAVAIKPYLPSLGLRSPVKGESPLYPSVDATEGHHSLGCAAYRQGDDGGVGEWGLVWELSRGVVEFLAATIFRFVSVVWSPFLAPLRQPREVRTCGCEEAWEIHSGCSWAEAEKDSIATPLSTIESDKAS